MENHTMTKAKTGFGLLRFPKIDDTPDNYDYDAISKMVDRYMEMGGRYFDTCYTYLNGCSEKAVKECLVQRHPPFLIIAKKNESRLFSCLLSFYTCTMQSAVLFIYLRIDKSAGKTDFRYTF